VRFLRCFYPILVLVTLLAASLGAAEPVTLDTYLAQVSRGHFGYVASQKSLESSTLKAGETRLITTPSLIGMVQNLSDEKFSPFFPYQRFNQFTAQLGVQKQWSFGLQSKLTFTYNSIEYQFTRPKYYEGHPALELSLPLLRNWMGSETQAQIAQGEAAARATQFAQSAQGKALLAEAEIAYFRLYLARESLTLARQVVTRSEDLYKWSERRSRLQLGDISDSYQAQAALEIRRLSLKAAESEERVAIRQYNLARGADLTTDPGVLITPPGEVIKRFASKRDAKPESDSLKAAQAQSDVAAAASRAAVERNRGSVDLYGSQTLNSNESNTSKAISKSFSLDRPTTVVGVKWTVPFAFGTSADVRDGYRLDAVAAELTAQRRALEDNKEWQELSQRIQDLEDQLVIAERAEQLQLKKLKHEQDRLSRGRTTTYQLIVFESDYTTSKLSRITLETQLAQLAARAQTFF
jgi:outer membrane protein TolC